eukprot:SAG22_NODE_607_length_8603_cov_4.554327_8_plen_164_part_00
MCASVPNAYAAAKTPTFVSNNAFDGFQLFDMGGAPSLKRVRNGSAAAFKYVQYVGAAVRRSIQARAKPGDGYFVTACVQHPMAWTSADGEGGPFGPTIAGCTHAQAVATWVGGRGASPPPAVLPSSSSSSSAPECSRVSIDTDDRFEKMAREPCNGGVFGARA